jgi:hypothetical protein
MRRATCRYLQSTLQLLGVNLVIPDSIITDPTADLTTNLKWSLRHGISQF